MVTHFFTSDYHLGHENIIKYTNRPFKNVYEMNKVIIENHNSIVKPEDIVFFLGDFCFKNSPGGKQGLTTPAKEYLNQLNGNFVFIQGNHDHNNGVNAILLNGTIEIGGKEIFIIHNPRDYDPTFEINLVGHVHKAWEINKIYKTYLINVGCDVWDFKPITINEILNRLKKYKEGI